MARSFAETIARARRIKATGYGYRETAPFYVWNGSIKNPCGHPVEGLAKLRRVLLRDPHLYATGHELTPARAAGVR